MTDGSTVLIQNQGLLPAGGINLTAGGTVLLSGTSLDKTISTGVVSETLGGKGSDISISAKDLVLDNGAQLLTRTFRAGQGGSLTVNTSESIQVLSYSLTPLIIPSNIVTATFGTGNGGVLNLATQNLSVQKGAQVIAATFGAGRGGDLNVNSFNSINLSGYTPNTSTVSSSLLAETNGTGNGGNLVLKTKNLTLQEGAVLGTLTFRSGLGGSTSVNADKIEVNGNNPTSFLPSVINAATFGSGNGGDLAINTAQLVIADGGRVDTATLANGKAGNLTINASDSVNISGTVPGSVNPSLIDSSANILDKNLQLFYHLPPIPSGDAGNLTISTKKLRITNGANISVQNQGPGQAGTLRINANSIFLDNKGGITASSTSGEGGNLFFRSQNLQLRHNSNITASAQGGGNGGNINIHTPILAALENSTISANALNGTGGKVTINAQGVFSSLDAITAIGKNPQFNGIVQINIPAEINLARAAGNPVTPPPSPQVVSVCSVRSGSKVSSLVNTGTGGIPPSSSDPLSGNTGWQDTSLPLQTGENARTIKQATTQPDDFAPVTGWIVYPDGTMNFTSDTRASVQYSSSDTCRQVSTGYK